MTSRGPVSSRRVTPPPTFVLIPGAWHGAWCWHRLTPLLESQGARVIAPDMPSQAGDDSSAQFVADLVARNEGCVLLGHSRGGALISRAAEHAPDSIRMLVYLCAYLLPDGQDVAEEARRDTDSLLAPNMVPVKRGLTCRIRDDVLREAFYGECSDEDFAFAHARLTPEPLRALAAPVRVSAGRFGRVPRAYIETSRDRAITLAAQRRMQSALPCEPVFTLDTDHSPFLSQPEALARILISI
jgi:pimeloyl-ACP methyl ester carboxylesterase